MDSSPSLFKPHMPAPRGGKFSAEQVELMLAALALNGGNATKTAAELETDYGISVTSNTLNLYAKSLHAERYIQIQTELRQKISEKVAGTLSEVALRSAEVQAEIVERLSSAQEELRPHELPQALRGVAQAAATAVDKVQLLRGQPTEITADRTPEVVLEELHRLGVNVSGIRPVQEGEAEPQPFIDDPRELGRGESNGSG